MPQSFPEYQFPRRLRQRRNYTGQPDRFYTWQRRCKENSRRMGMDVPWFSDLPAAYLYGAAYLYRDDWHTQNFYLGPAYPNRRMDFLYREKTRL